MIALYLFSCLPAVIWTVLYFYNRKIHVWEAVGSLGVSLLLAGITHYFSFRAQTGDTETWSGQVQSVRMFSSWTEKYQEAVYKTEEYYTGTGENRTIHTRQVFSHYEWLTSFHPRYNIAYSNIGEYSIADGKYSELIKEFGGEKSVNGCRTTSKMSSYMIHGDPKDYVSINENKPIIPVTKQVSFTNRLKAGSIWDKKQPDKSLGIPGRPENNNPFKSNRLLGTANAHFSVGKLDELNAILGPVKGVDVNIVGYKTGNSQFGQYTESKWLGGNKNSLTICYGEGWVYCFGWSDSDVCKRNIEQLFLQNELNDSIFPKLEKEIRENYTKPDWKRFDYIQIQPGGWAWFWFVISLLICQGLYTWWCLGNNYKKDIRGFNYP